MPGRGADRTHWLTPAGCIATGGHRVAAGGGGFCAVCGTDLTPLSVAPATVSTPATKET